MPDTNRRRFKVPQEGRLNGDWLGAFYSLAERLGGEARQNYGTITDCDGNHYSGVYVETDEGMIVIDLIPRGTR